MIKEIKICDCCGKECDFFYTNIEIDICKECYESFEEWLKSKRLNEVKE